MREGSPATRAARVERNTTNQMDGLVLLKSLKRGEAALVFMDPQYRAIMDRQAYGNEGKRQKKRHALPSMSDTTILGFALEAARALRPQGHLLIWMDKFSLGSGHWRRWVEGTGLEIVDVIGWNTFRFGMGARSRGRMQYLVALQKPPLRAKGIWTDREIPDCWGEQADPTLHPHAKPYQLTERLIRSLTKRGDLVVDPCAGSYVVLRAALAARREFVGCDIAVGA